jgi:hypothetical protein
MSEAIASLAGGVLVGLGAALLLAVGGKIAGVSGIVAGLLRPLAHDVAWRAAFVLGLLAGGGLLFTSPSASASAA